MGARGRGALRRAGRAGAFASRSDRVTRARRRSREREARSRRGPACSPRSRSSSAATRERARSASTPTTARSTRRRARRSSASRRTTGEPHALAPRVEQLLVRAAYHFGDAPVVSRLGVARERGPPRDRREPSTSSSKGVSAADRSPRTFAAYPARASASTRTRARSSSTWTCATRATTGSTRRRPA